MSADEPKDCRQVRPRFLSWETSIRFVDGLAEDRLFESLKTSFRSLQPRRTCNFANGQTNMGNCYEEYTRARVR